MEEYGYSVEVPEGYEEAVTRTRLALRGEGFSIVTEAHVGGVLGPDAGDERQYLIMGMWTPTVSERNISEDLRVAVHLPCNVLVQETSGGAIVAALDPSDDIDEQVQGARELAAAARDALGRTLERVATSSP